MMELKAKLKPVKQVEVELNDKSVGVFDIISEWNGLVKLENSEGIMIIDSGDKTFIDKIFGSLLADDPSGHSVDTVIRISPNLIPMADD